MGFRAVAVVLLAGLLAGCGEGQAPVPGPDAVGAPCMDLAVGGFPVFRGRPQASKDEARDVPQLGFACRPGHYAVAVDPTTHSAAWVIESVRPVNWSGSPARQWNDVRPDPQMFGVYRVPETVFASMGGLSIAQFAGKDNVRSQEEMLGRTFYTSNMVPVAQGFNDAWGATSELIRKWAGTMPGAPIVVISGTIYTGSPDAYRWHGAAPETERSRAESTPHDGQIAIPDYLYRVILKPDTGKMFAFVLPNKPLSRSALGQQIVSVSDLEKMTGFTFFPLLPEEKAALYKSNRQPFQ